MAGNYFQRPGTQTPLKALPSAALRYAPVRTFNGSTTQRQSTALTVGQLSAPPPGAVTLQADQRPENKAKTSPAFPLPRLRERTSPVMMGLPAFTHANFFKNKTKLAFYKYSANNKFFQFWRGKSPKPWIRQRRRYNPFLSAPACRADDENRDAWCIIIKILKLPYIYIYFIKVSFFYLCNTKTKNISNR